MNLNKASLNIWYELFKNESYRKVSDRIVYLHTVEMLSKDDEIELKTMIGLEKKFLAEAQEQINHNQSIIKRVNHYRVVFEKDERLARIFLNRIKGLIAGTENITVDMVNEEYVRLMEKDMDINGHEELVHEYNDMISFEDDLPVDDEEYLSCGNPDCLTCKPVTEEENEFAFQRLLVDGYLDETNEEAMMELMIRINRLEDELAEFMDIGCGLDVEFFDDEDDEDDD